MNRGHSLPSESKWLTTHLDELGNAEVVRLCHDTHREIVGGTPYGNLVVKLDQDVVVKFGWGVTKEEVYNRIAAFEILDHNKVRRYIAISVIWSQI